MSFEEVFSVIMLGGSIIGVYIKTQIDLAVLKNSIKNSEETQRTNKAELQRQIDDNKAVVNAIFTKIDQMNDKIDRGFKEIYEHFMNCQK